MNFSAPRNFKFKLLLISLIVLFAFIFLVKETKAKTVCTCVKWGPYGCVEQECHEEYYCGQQDCGVGCESVCDHECGVPGGCWCDCPDGGGPGGGCKSDADCGGGNSCPFPYTGPWKCGPNGSCYQDCSKQITPTPTPGGPTSTPTPTSGPTPTPGGPPPPGCYCDPWENVKCGGWQCSQDKMYQSQWCWYAVSGALCEVNRRCVDDPSCVSSVSGYVFVDSNRNRRKDPQESCYEGPVNIWVDGIKHEFQSTTGCNTYGPYPVTKGMTHEILIYPIPPGHTATGWSGTCSGKPCSGGGSSCIFTESEINFGLNPFASSWFQTQGGDVHGEESVRSNIPGTCSLPDCDPHFSLELGGYPGVVSYQLSSGFGSGAVSSKGWLVKESYAAKQYTYGYFKEQLADQEFQETPFALNAIADPGPGKTNLYRFAGSQVFDTNKFNSQPIGGAIVVLIEGDLNIRQNIRLSRTGFIGLIVKGKIEIDDHVEALQGFYLSDGVISTGISDKQFKGTGVFVGWQGINLERDFKDERNNTIPAEIFEYAPNLLMNAPSILRKPRYLWLEVAP